MKKSTILAAACALSACAFGELMVKDGDTLAFLGDSITQQGQRNPDGYVNLVLRALEAEGVKVTAVKAGISGHKSNDMLKRLDKDVLSKKPRWMTLSCGVNDVWHQDKNRGVSLEDYQKNGASLPDATKQRREQELTDLQQRYQQYAQTADQEMSKAQSEKMQLISDKISKAIQEVGTSGGYVYVMDVTAGIPFINETISTDVTNQVKAKLGIK